MSNMASIPVHTHTHTRPFNDPLPGTTRVSRYLKGKTSLDVIEANQDMDWAARGEVNQNDRGQR